MRSARSLFKYLLLVPFASLILLGLSLQLKVGDFSISFTTLSIYIVFFLFFVTYGKQPRRKFLSGILEFEVFFAIVAFYIIIGFLVGNTFSNIKEDGTGFIHLLMIYYCARRLSIDDLKFVWRAIGFVALLALVKILYINFSNVFAEWTNVWQARKDPIPGTRWYRVVLNGGDIYFTFAFLTAVSMLILRSKMSSRAVELLVLLGSGFSVFISLSRSSYVGAAVGVLVVLIMATKISRVSRRKLILGVSFIAVLLISLSTSLSPLINFARVYTDRVEAYDRFGGALMWREYENGLVLDIAASDAYLGGGMGTSYYWPNNANADTGGWNTFTHDVFTWLLLNMGVIGLLAALFFLRKVYALYWRKIAQGTLEHEVNVLLISLISCLTALIVISIAANYLFFPPGAMFIGFMLAVLANTYDLARS